MRFVCFREFLIGDASGVPTHAPAPAIGTRNDFKLYGASGLFNLPDLHLNTKETITFIGDSIQLVHHRPMLAPEGLSDPDNCNRI